MTEIPKNIDEAWGLFNSRRFQHGRDESMYNSFSTALACLFAHTPSPVDRGTVPCECTKIAQDETCPVGYPSLLCKVCDGRGHVPAVKLDGSELWEIVFGIANDAAAEITDEQYQQIADAINKVFVDPIDAVATVNDPALVGIAEFIKDNGGGWTPCSGCYDTEDGHPTRGYDHSPALQTAIGLGCHECGGLGATWQHLSEQDIEDLLRDEQALFEPASETLSDG